MEEKPDYSKPGDYVEFAQQLHQVSLCIGPQILELEYLRATVETFYQYFAHNMFFRRFWLQILVGILTGLQGTYVCHWGLTYKVLNFILILGGWIYYEIPQLHHIYEIKKDTGQTFFSPMEARRKLLGRYFRHFHCLYPVC
jgi:hypothetical protein